MPRIDILTLRVDAFGCDYFLHEIAEIWREFGIDVAVVKGPDQPPTADLVVLHTDITTVPLDYLAAVRRYPASLNGHVADISKRLVSRELVASPADHGGQVIVKTNRNAGGLQEREIARMGLLPEIFLFATCDYAIYDSAAAVPAEVWSNKHLVVERFLPEREGDFYCLRTWMFLGSRETCSISYSREPLVKQRNVLRREAIEDVPYEIREMREELAFDFGKFDFGIFEGRPVLYDANRTPTLGDFPKEAYMPRVRHLAEGIWDYLHRP